MSGMDRLTDELLEAYVSGKWKSYERDNIEMARELLAHRRASQAAPAPQKPVAWAETDHKGKVIGVSMNQYPWHPTPLYAAPAPSDGLREAVARRILDDAISSVEDDMRADMEDAEDTGEHVDVGQYEIVLSYETAQTIRAALTASPAQEGGE